MSFKILMITRTYPFPAQSGDLIYTAGLIQGLSADPTIALSVFCGNGLPPVAQEKGVRWFGPSGFASRAADFAALTGQFPRAAERALPKTAMTELQDVLAANQFDLVLMNDANTIKALALVQGLNLPVIYISHNVVSDILPEIVRKVRGQLRRWLQMHDAAKYQKLEPYLVNRVAGLTAITQEDLDRYLELGCKVPCVVLKPGYPDTGTTKPLSMRQRNRVAVLVGSFEWNAKVTNLEAILAAYMRYRADETGSPFILRIAGKAAPALLQRLRSTFPDVEFTGPFDHLSDVVSDARVALVLEDMGGGFKLKTLDYIFSRLAIVGFSHALAGSDLRPDQDFIPAASVDDAMVKIRDLVTNYGRLDDLTASAFDLAKQAYRWEDRIKLLTSLIRQSILEFQAKNTDDGQRSYEPSP